MSTQPPSKDFFKSRDLHKATPNPDWYNPNITLSQIPTLCLPVLEASTHLHDQELVNHINTCREKAWEIQPYPCIGIFLYLESNIATYPLYPAILAHLKNSNTGKTGGETLLDMAYGQGQELRKLAFDGVDASRLYGVDLSQGLIDAGFDLFMDREGKGGKMHFATGDIFADEPLVGLPVGERSFDVIHVGAFFHLFRVPDQVVVGKKLAGFLREGSEGVLLGWNMGTEEAGELELGKELGAKVFSHSVESFGRLWEEVGRGMVPQVKWRVEAVLVQAPESGRRFASGERCYKGFEGGKMLMWSVRKV